MLPIFLLTDPQWIKIKPSTRPPRGSFITKNVYYNVFILLFKLAYLVKLNKEIDTTPVKLLDCALRTFVIL